MATIKGFIKDYNGKTLLPITRGELVLDQDGQIALTSKYFEAGVNNNAYGLISATDLAKLKGEGSGLSMLDIYNKLDFINSSLTIGNTTLHFYDNEGATSINIVGAEDQIIVSALNNNINIGLSEIGELSASNIIKSITVDKYGRVTAVSGSPLTNAEIPNLEGKTITSGTFVGGKTSTEAIDETDSTSIANKAYVDKQFAKVENIATGALVFKGSISSVEQATGLLNNSANFNTYYKVTQDFVLASDYLYSETETGSNGNIKAGDTLIIYKIDSSTSKYIHIPSGDEEVTLITVQDSNSIKSVDKKTGPITFTFDTPFVVNADNELSARISIPEASSTIGGYLTSDDYRKFSSYESILKVEYTSNVTEGSVGSYKIGTITIGDSSQDIFGLNNISTLTLENNTDNSDVNPILKFVETGVSGTSTKNIIIEGSAGIEAKKSGDTIKLTGAYTVASDSTDYLQISNGQIGAKIGSGNSDSVTPGLTKYSDFIATKETVDALLRFAQLSHALTLEGSLIEGANDVNGTVYKYGNDALKTAITVTI